MKVSVVVPVRDEERSLGALLDSLLAQTTPPDEIVLADGGSTDATVALARTYADRGVRLLEIGPAYPGQGRNAAIREARNDWVALVDGGCVADPAWLENLLSSREALPAEAGVVVRVLEAPKAVLVAVINETPTKVVRRAVVDGRPVSIPVEALRSRLVLLDRAGKVIVATPGDAVK